MTIHFTQENIIFSIAGVVIGEILGIATISIAQYFADRKALLSKSIDIPAIEEIAIPAPIESESTPATPLSTPEIELQEIDRIITEAIEDKVPAATKEELPKKFLLKEAKGFGEPKPKKKIRISLGGSGYKFEELQKRHFGNDSQPQ